MSPMRERRVENHLRREVRRLGGRTDKLAPTTKGMPDRLVLLPGGQIWLVELKAPDGVLSPAQMLWSEHAKELGTHVVVLNSLAEVTDWITAREGETKRHFRPGRGGACEVRR